MAAARFILISTILWFQPMMGHPTPQHPLLHLQHPPQHCRLSQTRRHRHRRATLSFAEIRQHLHDRADGERARRRSAFGRILGLACGAIGDRRRGAGVRARDPVPGEEGIGTQPASTPDHPIRHGIMGLSGKPHLPARDALQNGVKSV